VELEAVGVAVGPVVGLVVPAVIEVGDLRPACAK
jgi:hypothetical protein